MIPSWQHLDAVAATAGEKRARLVELLGGMDGGVLVAFSGGVDSSFLLHEAHRALGERCVAAIALSESLASAEAERAVALASAWGVRLEQIRTLEIENPDYVKNAPDRCYFCKKELFERMDPLARALGVSCVAYGAMSDDVGDHRPGTRAAREHRVRAPLQEVGLGKDEIRFLSREAGLPTWDLPAQACLSSRFAYGQPIDRGRLRAIEQAEAFIRGLGVYDVRVRHHDKTARIEVGVADIALLASEEVRPRVLARLRELGYLYVTLDLAGFRSGSMNLVLPRAED